MKIATRINSFFREGDRDLKRVLARFSEIGLTHVDLNYPEHVSGIDAEAMKGLLNGYGLTLNGVALRFREKFINGELGNADTEVARSALKLCHEACDYCRIAGGDTVTIWLGFDGFDYSFQIDYDRVFRQLVHQFQDICDYAPDLHISIEYKPFQERSYAFIDSMGLVSWIVSSVDRKNLGVTLDHCHMLMKHENPAMAADLFGARGKLFGIHLNDGYGTMDDGLMVGMSTPVKTLELLYYLKKHGFDHTLYFDTFPVIEDASDECRQNIETLRLLLKALDSVGEKKIQQGVDSNDAIQSAVLVRELFCAMGR